MNPQDCRYTELKNGIHEFVFLTDDKAGADVLIAGLERLFETYSVNDMLRIIIDFHKPKNPPTLYTFRQAVQMFQRYPEHPYMRAANIYNQGFIIGTLKMYTSILRQDRKNARQFFPATDRNKAISWLLESPNP